MVKKESDTKNRTAYKNQHRKDHYDTILFAFPKGEKEKIKIAPPHWGCRSMNISMHWYVMTSHPEKAGLERKNRDSMKNSVACWKSGRNIHCEKTSEIRWIIGKTHKK